jgi:hypothetical protein
VLTDSVFTAVPSFAAPSLAQLVSSRVSAAAGGGVVCDFMSPNFSKICVWIVAGEAGVIFELPD